MSLFEVKLAASATLRAYKSRTGGHVHLSQRCGDPTLCAAIGTTRDSERGQKAFGEPLESSDVGVSRGTHGYPLCALCSKVGLAIRRLR